eukprot:00645_1
MYCFPATARYVSISSLARTLKSCLETRVGSLGILPPKPGREPPLPLRAPRIPLSSRTRPPPHLQLPFPSRPSAAPVPSSESPQNLAPVPKLF